MFSEKMEKLMQELLRWNLLENSNSEEKNYENFSKTWVHQ